MSDPVTDRSSALKRALLALHQLEGKLDAVERSRKEPIAIIGMGCRFPGGSIDPSTYWENLIRGFDGVSEVPPDRWDVDAFYDPDPEAPGKTYSRHGGFLEEVDKFDPAFFGIPPRDVIRMDPQHRLLLEVSWEALENAGIPPVQLIGSNTGVFVGITARDYERVLDRGGVKAIEAYDLTGNPLNFASGRLAYVFGFQGPAMAVDTACSSSLVAVHLACQSLRLEECTLAVAGGVNLMLSPHNHIVTSKARMLSPSGRCRTFDAAADGIVRSEGCGVLVLKRLRDALADHDSILALIRGSAVNQDGPSSGLTVPHKQAQVALIRDALKRAGVDPLEVGYIEAHGTGTPLGDPIEVRALEAALCKGRPAASPLWMASVKTNIGHAESAAGVAGLIKVCLALQHHEIPPHLHLQRLNPHMIWDDLPIRIPLQRTPWTQERRIAGVSSFGASGTNAHLVLEQAPPVVRVLPAMTRPAALLTLSARGPEALKSHALQINRYLAHHTDVAVGDLCHSLNIGRSHFDCRLAVVATSTDQLQQDLAGFADGDTMPTSATGVFEAGTSRPGLAFLFTGQGSQYPGMGRGLYDTQPVFRNAVDRCDAFLRSQLKTPLLSVLFPDSGQDSPIHDTAYAQPALFVLEYALSEMLQSWGVVPDRVMGHSVGEVVAACVAGVFSLEDGLTLITKRGQLMQAQPGEGMMVSVQADREQVEAAVRPFRSTVSIAAINGPKSVVISGRRDDVHTICGKFEANGIKTKDLVVSHAFHSPQMDPVVASFEAVVQQIQLSAPRIPLVSNLTGTSADADITTPEYWGRHIRRPVLFSDGMAELRAQGCSLFLEIGPHPTLLGMGAACFASDFGTWLPSLRKNHDDWNVLLASLGRLYLKGRNIDWRSFDEPYGFRRISLPTYPFQRQRYWPGSGKFDSARDVTDSSIPSSHPLLGQRMRLPPDRDIRFETLMSPRSPAYLDHHRLWDTVVVPGASHISMALLGAKAAYDIETCVLEDLVFPAALVLSDQDSRPVQLVLEDSGDGQAHFEIVSIEGGGEGGSAPLWTTHGTGRIRYDAPSSPNQPPHESIEAILARCGEPSSGADLYRRFWAAGYTLGSAFCWIGDFWRGDREALVRMNQPSVPDDPAAYPLYPGLLDSCFQALGTLGPDVRDRVEADSILIPFSIGSVRFFRAPDPGEALWCHIEVKSDANSGGTTLAGDIRLLDATGQILAQVVRFEGRKVDRTALLRSLQRKPGTGLQDLLYALEWRPKPIADAPSPLAKDAGLWVILGDRRGLGDALAERIRARGEGCIQVKPGASLERTSPHTFTLDLTDPDAFDRLLKEIREEADTTIHGVVSLWSLDAEPTGEPAATALLDSSSVACAHVIVLVQALVNLRAETPPGLWIVTRGAQSTASSVESLRLAQAPIWGLGRVLRLEHPELHSVLVDLDPDASTDDVETLLTELGSKDGEDQLSYRSGSRYVARLARANAVRMTETAALALPPTESYRLLSTRRGVLDHLSLEPCSRRDPGVGEVEIAVRASGLNFREVLFVLKMFSIELEDSDSPSLGGECSGTIVAIGEGVRHVAVGEDVIAFAPGCFSRYVTCDARFVVRKPPAVSHEDAATIPVAFLTAWYALHHLCQVQAGQRVLIHAAAGGVGMAAVQLAKRAGAEVFGTASPGKWDALRVLGVEHIMNSRTLDFSSEVILATDGCGVDIVLNSLAGEFIPKSLALLSSGGRFIEMGKAEIWDPVRVAEVRSGIHYHPFDILDFTPELVQQILQEIVGAFERRELHPLPRKVFPITDAVNGFRYMAQGKHIGKIVFLAAASRLEIPGITIRERLQAGSYLLTGGTGYLALELAKWLAEQGAAQLFLVGRSTPSPAALQMVSKIEAIGARVRILPADVTDREQIAALIGEISTTAPPLRGIVHAAGVLDDGMLLQLDQERLTRVMAPKVAGAWNLHELTQKHPLDFFVLFSSVSSLLGSPGQSNYAAGNSFMDVLAHYRHGLGLPALSINWGPWAEGGMAANVGTREKGKWAQQGFGSIATDEGIRVFAQSLESHQAQVAVIKADWTRVRSNQHGGTVPPLLIEVVPAARRVAGGKSASELIARLKRLPPEERRASFQEVLQGEAAKVLGLASPRDVPLQRPFKDLGLDSLMAVELRNAISALLGRPLQATLLFDYPTLSEMSEYLLQELLGSDAQPKEAQAEKQQAEDSKLQDQLKKLSDDDLIRYLEDELTFKV